MKLLLFFWSLLAAAPVINAQIAGLSAVYDDSFQEWTIITFDSTDTDGVLELKYGFGSTDRSAWDYRIGELSGDISLQSGSGGRLWQMTSYDGNLTIRRVWPGDDGEWEISDGVATLILKARFPNNAEEWRITDEKDGYLDVFTLYQGDARDWVIEETLSETYRVEHKLAAVFIAMLVATGGY